MVRRIHSLPGYLLLALLSAWIVGLPMTGFAAGTVQRARSVLQGVTALNKPVSFTETKVPLGELLQHVAAETGIKLSASPNVADEPVAVVVKQFPAGELLTQLADLLDYQWRRRGSAAGQHYEIWQDPASQQREELLRRSLVAHVEGRLGEALRQLVAMAALSQEQIEREVMEGMRAQFDWASRLQSDRELPLLSPEETARFQRVLMARQLWSPVNRTMVRLLGSLTPQQWALLRDQQLIVFSTHPQADDLLLPVEIARSFRASRPLMMKPAIPSGNGSVEAELQEHVRKLQERERKLQARWAAASGYRVWIYLTTEYLEKFGTLDLNAHVEPIEPHELKPADPVPAINRFPSMRGVTEINLSVRADGFRCLGKWHALGSAGRSDPPAEPHLAPGAPARSPAAFAPPLGANAGPARCAALEEYLTMASTLNDAQLEYLSDLERQLVLRELADFGLAYDLRYALRLYRLLTPGQQQALWRGKALSMNQMTPAARALFLRAARATRPDHPVPPNVWDWTDGSFSLTSERITPSSSVDRDSPAPKRQPLLIVSFYFHRKGRIHSAGAVTVARPIKPQCTDRAR